MDFKQVLRFYDDLASDSPEVRMKAAVAILKWLNEKNSDQDWEYAFKRLLRGLSSSRGSSRLGFSMALAEVLNARKDSISATHYLDLCSEFFKVPKSTSGHEERGLRFGMLFAIQSLVQSPIINNATEEELSRCIGMLIDLASKKAWLRETCFYTLCAMFESKSMPKEIVKHTLQAIDDRQFTLTSEGVAFYLSLSAHDRKYARKFDAWKHGDPLSKGNLPSLVKALKEVYTGEAKQKGNWNPSLHFVWQKLAEQLLQAQPEDEDNEQVTKKRKTDSGSKQNEKVEKIRFAEFWKAVVDEGLFANSASSERKYWGLMVFSLFVNAINDPAHIEQAMSPNLIRTLTNHLNQQDRNLNKLSKKVLDTLTENCQSKPQLTLPVIRQLLFSKSASDKTSKVKPLVDRLTPLCAEESIKDLVALVGSIFDSPPVDGGDEKAVNVKRTWAADYILNVVKQRIKNAAQLDWVESVIDFLVLRGYSKVKADPKLNEANVELCQSRLNSVLTAIVGMKRTPESEGSWAYFTIDRILKLERDGDLSISFEGDLLKAKDKAVKTLEKIRKKRKSPHVDSSQLYAFELLFSLVLIQVYSTDSDAATVLDELQMCYNNILGKASNQEGDDDDEIDTSQVLTDIILMFLSRKSVLLRRLCETVWKTFSADITGASLDLLYNVLAAKENEEGQKEIFEGDMDVDEDEDDEDEDDEDEDDEMDNGDEEEEDEDEEEDEEEDDEDEDEDDGNDDDDDEEEDDAIKEADRKATEALAAALGVSDGEEGSDEESGDDDSDNESMDDQQMMALDGQLAEIFRQRQKALEDHKPTQKKQEAKDAKENVVQLKSRVLDLLDIYVDKESTNPLLLTLIVPLLSLIRTTKNKQVGEKAHQLVRKLCKVKQQPVNIESEQALTILSDIHAQAKKSTNKSHGLACNQASTFISKLLISNDNELTEKVVAIYADSLTQWISKRSKATPALFIDLVNWASSRKN
uniref:ARAD1C13244p n=1 Tax=Blastobotrys adeninivorans TaxID=409370 RepID=A0A060T5K6_BLAAD